jgi:hypothetical protein
MSEPDDNHANWSLANQGLAQDIAVKESLEPPHLASKVPFASVQSC